MVASCSRGDGPIRTKNAAAMAGDDLIASCPADSPLHSKHLRQRPQKSSGSWPLADFPSAREW